MPKSEIKTLSRRCFLCGSVSVGIALLGSSVPGQRSIPEQKRAVNDRNIILETIEFKSGSDSITAYLARPKRKVKYRAITVVPGNWIVEPYIAETAAMLAQQGFVGLAVDVFPFFPRVKSYDSITDAEWDASGDLVKKEYSEERVSKIVNSGIEFLKTKDFVKKKRFGVMGFCGAMYSATQNKEIAAVVPFYAPPNFNAPTNLRAGSRPTPMEFADKLKIPVQGHFGTKDKGIRVDDVKQFEKKLKEQGTPVRIFFYEAGHGFFAYNRGESYNSELAMLAWDRTIKFFKTQLR